MIVLVLSRAGLQAGVSPLLALSVAIIVGLHGNFEPARWKDGATMGALGVAFLGAFLLPGGLELVQAFLFVSVAILTFQLMSFRTTVSSVRRLRSPEGGGLKDLGAVFLALVARGIFTTAFVFIISSMVLAVASGFVLQFRVDFVVFLLALAVLMALFLTYGYERRTSG